ncbi:MAG: hypothetical protein Q7T97_02535 [Burkholderiaceae bacterium]|nr:hypothetical protein [Burkholderiaceae bacterium]
MTIPTSFTDLSTTPLSNSPAGSDSVFPDNPKYTRFNSAALASIYLNTATNGWVSPYLATAGGTMAGATILNGALSGTGLTNYLAAPGPFGVTTPNLGRFTAAYTAPVVVTFNATTMAIDCALSNVFTTTFTANVTVAPTLSNLKDGQTINWFITQDATGTRTMTWPASFKWPGATAGVLSTAASSVDLLVATYRSSTGFWYASLSKGFA